MTWTKSLVSTYVNSENFQKKLKDLVDQTIQDYESGKGADIPYDIQNTFSLIQQSYINLLRST